MTIVKALSVRRLRYTPANPSGKTEALQWPRVILCSHREERGGRVGPKRWRLQDMQRIMCMDIAHVHG